MSASALTGAGQVADAGRQVGEQPRELAPRRAQRDAQLGWVDDARGVLERLDERPVRRTHDRVAGAVEDEHAGPAASAANSRTRRLLPEPGSPLSRTTRRPSPSAIGMSARSVSSSDERPTKGNVEVRRREPGSSYMARSAGPNSQT